MSVELTDDQYLDLLLRRQKKAAPRRRFSIGGCIVWVLAAIMFVVFIAALLPNIAASYPGLPVLSQFIGTPQAVFSTRQETPGAARQGQGASDQQQPAGLPAGGAAPWPTLTPEPAQQQPTTTPAPTANPTAAAHLTAIAVQFAPTETAQTAEWKAIEGPYFYDPYTLATPEAGFTEYVAAQCADQEKIRKSFLLQQMCEGE